MKNFLLALTIVFTLPFAAHAETQAVAQARVLNILQASGVTSRDVTYLANQLKSAVLYATAAELLAAAPADGTIGYAQDTDVYYFMTNSSWVAISSFLTSAMTNGATISNAVNNHVNILENAEDLDLVYSNNLVTITSTTGATVAITPAVAVAGDITISGGAGAITCGAAGCSLLATDNSATGYAQGSAGATSTVVLDTRDGAEGQIITGYQTVSGLSTATGGLSTTKPLFLHDRLRFCGNGSNGATAWYDGPVLESDGATDFSIGSAGCDANDSGTEATADRPIDAYHVIKVVGMECVTQAGGAADTNTFQLRNATANVSGMVCTVTNDGSLAKQCSVILAAPVTVPVNTTLAIKNTQSGTDDMSAKDMGCTVYYTF